MKVFGTQNCSSAGSQSGCAILEKHGAARTALPSFSESRLKFQKSPPQRHHTTENDLSHFQNSFEELSRSVPEANAAMIPATRQVGGHASNITETVVA
ncbi:MAG: hypothetical protein GY789_09895 [Hyphomicrobiales bacterium]|nr:hypothetical protein [Hyphomicrobiales bacterium]MCP5000756.1 hypothetical protein [Hyphomicrobiales bacterium]